MYQQPRNGQNSGKQDRWLCNRCQLALLYILRALRACKLRFSWLTIALDVRPGVAVRSQVRAWGRTKRDGLSYTTSPILLHVILPPSITVSVTRWKVPERRADDSLLPSPPLMDPLNYEGEHTTMQYNFNLIDKDEGLNYCSGQCCFCN